MRSSRVVWKSTQLHLVGCANGAGGRVLGSEHAAPHMHQSKILQNSTLRYKWEKIVNENNPHRLRGLGILPEFIKMTKMLAFATKDVMNREQELAVIGGDHSCAIGTWTGVAKSNAHKGPIGLIWIDAHMDSHTPTSSHSGNLHGMPVAHLLGHGDPRLCDIFDISPKIRSHNLVIVGARSFEDEERAFLENNKVAVFHDCEVKKRGIKAVMDDAVAIATDGTHGFGMSIDLDGFRVPDAPAVGTPEKGGIIAEDFIHYLKNDMLYNHYLATEIVEFNPSMDDENKTTEKLIVHLLEAIYLTKWQK